MYTLDELKTQNADISELIDVLAALIDHEDLRGNTYVCELAAKFNEKVWMHLVFEDNTIYSELARHNNPDISRIARQFHDSAREIKKDFSSYIKLWCKTITGQANGDNFVEQSEKIFRLIRQRIRYEQEEMFPMAEQHFEN